jgi:hypothetical protein
MKEEELKALKEKAMAAIQSKKITYSTNLGNNQWHFYTENEDDDTFIRLTCSFDNKAMCQKFDDINIFQKGEFYALVERDFSVATRKYETIKNQYETLLNKLKEKDEENS